MPTIVRCLLPGHVSDFELTRGYLGIKIFIAVAYRYFGTRIASKDGLDQADMCSANVMDEADAFMDAVAEGKLLLSFHRSECDASTVLLSG